METEAGPVQAFVQKTAEAARHSLELLTQETVIWSVIYITLVFILRKQLSALGLFSFKALLKRFEVKLSDEVAAQLETATEILFVTLAFYLAVDKLSPNDLFLHRILSSVAIVTVFSAWYQLSGSFASLLRNDTISPVSNETDWVQRVTQFSILLFGLTSLLRVWQVDIAGALTGVGVLGAGLAIATQDLLRNLVAGVTNISEKRFETGDAIRVEGQFMGTVKRIDLRSTLVVGYDQIPRYIPNSDLSNAVVLNYSALQHRRVMLKVPLVLSSTQEQIETVRDNLKEYLNKSGDFDLGEAAPKYVNVSELGPSSVDILIYARTTGPDYGPYLEVCERLTLFILGVVREAGTSLAYPTQTLHLEADGSKAGYENPPFGPST